MTATISMPTTRLEVADHLDAAADVILAKGLARGSWIDGTGQVCSNQALAEAIDLTSRGNFDTMNAYCPVTLKAFALYLLGRVLDPEQQGWLADPAREVANNPARFIANINDSSQHDMGEAMRHCAKFLREEEGKTGQ